MIAWTSTLCGMLGALLCAAGYQNIGYPIFLLGSIAGAYVLRNNKAMLAQFAFYSACNAYGIYNFTL